MASVGAPDALRPCLPDVGLMPDEPPTPAQADAGHGPSRQPVEGEPPATEGVDPGPAGGAPAESEPVEPGPVEPEPVDSEIRDELPADLDVTGLVGPYMFPDNGRRRVQGVIHLVAAAVLVALWLPFANGGVLVNRGYLLVAGILAVAAAYSFATARKLQVRELDALAAAAREVGFPVGHASAQMAWRGLLSIPTWRVLVFSADEPPTSRALVVVDGVTGDVLGSAVEDNPEDWLDDDR